MFPSVILPASDSTLPSPIWLHLFIILHPAPQSACTITSQPVSPLLLNSIYQLSSFYTPSWYRVSTRMSTITLPPHMLFGLLSSFSSLFITPDSTSYSFVFLAIIFLLLFAQDLSWVVRKDQIWHPFQVEDKVLKYASSGSIIILQEKKITNCQQL